MWFENVLVLEYMRLCSEGGGGDSTAHVNVMKDLALVPSERGSIYSLTPQPVACSSKLQGCAFAAPARTNCFMPGGDGWEYYTDLRF
jgi:hypothetical protein